MSETTRRQLPRIVRRQSFLARILTRSTNSINYEEPPVDTINNAYGVNSYSNGGSGGVKRRLSRKASFLESKPIKSLAKLTRR
jgi:hypothetical protein